MKFNFYFNLGYFSMLLTTFFFFTIEFFSFQNCHEHEIIMKMFQNFIHNIKKLFNDQNSWKSLSHIKMSVCVTSTQVFLLFPSLPARMNKKKTHICHRGVPLERGGPDFFFSYIFDFWEGSKKFSHTNFNLEGGSGPPPLGYAHDMP